MIVHVHITTEFEEAEKERGGEGGRVIGCEMQQTVLNQHKRKESIKQPMSAREHI